MKNFIYGFSLLSLFLFTTCTTQPKEAEWIELFNGKDLTGWTASEHPESFRVENGMIVANGERAHLFYTDEVADGKFKNFELRVEVMTLRMANSGVFIHTAFQEEGWPSQGYEVQVNNTHIGADDYRELKKSGSLYGVRNVYKAFAKDSVWYTMNIRVEGKHVTSKIDDVLVVDYTEPQDVNRLVGGTFALQGHDPLSKVYFRSIKVKLLDDNLETATPGSKSYPEILEAQSKQYAFVDMDVDVPAQGGMDDLIKTFYESGVSIGLVARNPEELSTMLTYNKSYPVFLGMKIDDPMVIEELDPALTGQLDFIAYESYIPEEVAGDVDAFMTDYANGIAISIMESGATVWVNPLALPATLRDRATELWTTERMKVLIDAAKQTNCAIQINNELKEPTVEFIKLAKANGCRFTFSDFYTGSGVSVSYALEVIKACELDYRDIYIPDRPMNGR